MSTCTIPGMHTGSRAASCSQDTCRRSPCNTQCSHAEKLVLCVSHRQVFRPPCCKQWVQGFSGRPAVDEHHLTACRQPCPRLVELPQQVGHEAGLRPAHHQQRLGLRVGAEVLLAKTSSTRAGEEEEEEEEGENGGTCRTEIIDQPPFCRKRFPLLLGVYVMFCTESCTDMMEMERHSVHSLGLRWGAS